MGKFSILMNIEFYSEPVYGDNDKYIKAKIKLYGDKVNTKFQGKKIPKENASYKCLSLIMLDSVIKIIKKVLSSDTSRRMQVWNKKDWMENLINNDLDLSSSDNEADNESDDESEFDNDE